MKLAARNITKMSLQDQPSIESIKESLRLDMFSFFKCISLIQSSLNLRVRLLEQFLFLKLNV